MKKPVSYMQTDPRWASIDYSAKGEKTNIGKAGCGPSCMAMVIASLKDSKVTPKETAAWSLSKGCKAKGQGTYYSYFEPQGKAYGLTVRQVNGASLYKKSSAIHKQMTDAVKTGDWVVCCMGKGTWTSSGHFVLWYGVEGGDVLIHDPNSTRADRIKALLAKFQAEVKYYFLVDVPEGKEEDEVVEKVQMKINGKMQTVDRILKDGANYVKIGDLAAAGAITTSYDTVTKMVTINAK